MPRPSRDYERAALDSGEVTVDAEGHVWRLRRHGRPCARYGPVERPRADGYLMVPLYLHGRRIRLLAHRLVYEARVEPIPDGYRVRHRNLDRGDNRPSNLLAVPGDAPPVRRRQTAATGAPAAAAATDGGDDSDG